MKGNFWGRRGEILYLVFFVLSTTPFIWPISVLITLWKDKSVAGSVILVCNSFVLKTRQAAEYKFSSNSLLPKISYRWA